MELQKEEREDLLIIKIEGTFSIQDVPTFETFVSPIKKDKNFAFDFEKMKTIDSSGIGALLEIFKALQKVKKKLYIFNMNDFISRVFTSAKLTVFFNPITQDELDKKFPSADDTSEGEEDLKTEKRKHFEVYSEETRKDLVIISLKGYLIIDHVEKLQEFIQPFRKDMNFAINFKDLEMIDSAGIGAILQIYKEIQGKKKKLYVYNMNQFIKKLFTSSKLINFFNVVSEQELNNLFPTGEIQYELLAIKPPDKMGNEIENVTRKIYIHDLIDLLYQRNRQDFYLIEDCTQMKRGRNLNLSDAETFKQKGYDYLWVTNEYNEPEEDSDEEFLYEVREALKPILLDLVFEINEKDFNSRGGKVEQLSGEDLFSNKLNDLQAEGARNVLERFVGDGNKINQIKNILDKFSQRNIKKIGIFDNRTYGSKINQGDKDKSSDEFINYLLNHSISVTLIFIVIAKNIQSDRVLKGAKSSTMKYEGEEKIDKSKRVVYPLEYILNTALGCLFHDFGYMHSTLRKTIKKLLNHIRDVDCDMISDLSLKVDKNAADLYTKHPNVIHNILSSARDVDVISPLGKNLIKNHQSFLDGTGFPSRGKYFKNNNTYFKVPLHEFTRLFTIIDYIDEMLTRKPWHLPFGRTNIIDFVVKNSVQTINPYEDTTDQDLNDIDSTQRHFGKFDPVLLKYYLKSVNLYRLGESVILTNLTNGRQFMASVYKYSDVAHRPVVKTKIGKKEGLMDLSKDKFKDFIIDEVFPCANVKML